MALSTQWIIAPPRKSIVVGVADAAASNDTGADLITHSLGSCLGVVIYDATARVAGLLHAMLPDSSLDPARARQQPCLFVDTGMGELVKMVAKLGGNIARAQIKVAGGAQMLDEKGVFRIGERNFQMLQRVLSLQGLRLAAREVGGVASRTLRINVATGEVTIRCPGEQPRRL